MKYDARLRYMEFAVEFDRPVDKTKHYISPGGYELNGKPFDFCAYEGEIIGSNIVHFVVSDFDYDYANENNTKLRKVDLTREFTEFYIYTGEHDDPEIIPTKINYILFGTEDGWVRASKRTLASANRCLREVA